MVGAQFSPSGGHTAPLPRIPPAPKQGGRHLLKGAGLLAVAVVSGLIWWLIRHEDEPIVPVAQVPAREFDFVLMEGPHASTDCAAKSTDDVKRWLSEHRCQQLFRALYITTKGDARALVFVALVTMPTAEEAQQLKAITDTDGTGNVTDLVKDGTAKISGAPKLQGGEYESQASGKDVTIVLASFFDKHTDDALLKRISVEALQLTDKLR